MKKRKNITEGASQRQLRVGEQIRHILSTTLQNGHFNSELLLNKSNTIIVSEVRPSPDLRHARAYVMSINGENMEELLVELNKNAHVFQKEIARGTSIKFTPRIRFETDNSFDEAQHIESLLRDVRKEEPEETTDDFDANIDDKTEE